MAARRLGGASEEPVCVGVHVGLFYALAPFVCMYLLWSVEREHKASFKCRSRWHYILQFVVKIQAIGREKFRRASTKMLKTTQALG